MSSPRPARTRVKICGVRTAEDVRAAADAGADAIGLMRVESSPRHVDALVARDLARAAPPFLTPVAVFAHEDLDLVAEAPARVIQLHGREDEDYLRHLHERRPDARLIRGFRFSPHALRRWDRCDFVAALLVDGSDGGAGTAFDHDELATLRDEITKPLILAGGLTADNVADAIARLRPHAVDVSSGVECTRGRKDPALIHAFCQAVLDARA